LKCISKRRLFNDIFDCYYEDFLQINQTCSTEGNQDYFKCETSNRCISRSYVNNMNCDCILFGEVCDDEETDQIYARKTISFQTIWDGQSHLAQNYLEDQNETDETNCQYWPRVHIYNRCDGFWDNLNGSDKMNCYSSSL